MITRFLLFFTIGKDRFHRLFLPYFSPLALAGLLYTIIVIFAQQARHILHNLGPVFRTIVPLILYFSVMFTTTFTGMWWWSNQPWRKGQVGYEEAAVQSFTAASNNFVSGSWASCVDTDISVGVIYCSLCCGLWPRVGPSASSNYRTPRRGARTAFLDLGCGVPRAPTEMGRYPR